MEIKKRHFFIPLVICIILIVTIAGYLYLIRSKQTALPAIKAVPSNVALILQSSSPEHIWSALSGTTFWNGVAGIDGMDKFTRTIRWLDSISASDANASLLFSGQRFIASVHPAKDQTAGVLFISELPDPRQTGLVRKLINRLCLGCQVKFEDYDRKSIYAVTLSGMKDILYYTVTRGLFISSFQPLLVEQALDHLKKGNPVDKDTVFTALQNAAGKNSGANIFINNRELPFLLNQIINKAHERSLSSFMNFAGWSEFDLNINEGELVLNGFTSSGDTIKNFLEIFKNQQGKAFGLHHILPYNTAFFVDITISDYHELFSRFKSHLKAIDSLGAYQKLVNSLNQSTTVDIESEMKGWGIHEMGIAAISNAAQPDSAIFFVMVIDNPVKCKQDLMELAMTIIENKHQKKSAIDTSGYAILKLDVNLPITYFFKPFLPHYTPDYYCVIDNFLLFSNNQMVLDQVINKYRNGRVLGNDDNFSAFSNNLSEMENIFLYLNVRKSEDLTKKVIKPDLYAVIEKDQEIVRKFEGLSIQYMSLNNLFYSNVLMLYNPNYQQDENYIWRTSLDTIIRSGPFLVNNQQTGKINVMVSDVANNLYLLDETGHIRWTIKLQEPLLSGIFQVDYPKKDVTHYLFNTASQLYLVAIDGSNVDGYPINLREKAINGILAVDFTRKKVYNILYVSDNDRVHCLDLRGKQVAGWKNPEIVYSVSNPIQYLYKNQEDYIIVTMDDGSVLITDRKGSIRFTSGKTFVHCLNSSFYINHTNSKGNIITTTANGSLAYIQGKSSSSVSFTDLSAGHYFVYDDLTGDNDPDFIFIDSTNLYVFNRFRKQVFAFKFKAPVKDKPVVYALPSKEKILVVISRDEDRLYLFNKTELLNQDETINGDTDFIVGSLNKDQILNLVIGKVNIVYCYPVEGL